MQKINIDDIIENLRLARTFAGTGSILGAQPAPPDCKELGLHFMEHAAEILDETASMLRKRAAEQRDEAERGNSPLPENGAGEKPDTDKADITSCSHEFAPLPTAQECRKCGLVIS